MIEFGYVIIAKEITYSSPSRHGKIFNWQTCMSVLFHMQHLEIPR